jgi:hypothetical protein
MMGAQGGTVTANASGGQSINYAPVINLNGPVPQETVAQIRAMINESQSKFARQLSHKGFA